MNRTLFAAGMLGIAMISLSIDAHAQRGHRTLPPRIGVAIEDASTSKNADGKQEGARIRKVMEDSPAELAGLKPGDVIVELNNSHVEDAGDLQSLLRRSTCDSAVQLRVFREGVSRMVAVVPECPKMKSIIRTRRMPTLSFSGFTANTFSGLTLHPIRRQLAKFFQLPRNGGLLIEQVEKGSSAETAGLRAGDVIVTWNGAMVKDLDDLYLEMGEQEAGDSVNVGIIRDGKPENHALVLEEGAEDQLFQFFSSPTNPHQYRFRLTPPAMPMVPGMEDMMLDQDIDVDIDIQNDPGDSDVKSSEKRRDKDGKTKVIIRKKRVDADI